MDIFTSFNSSEGFSIIFSLALLFEFHNERILYNRCLQWPDGDGALGHEAPLDALAKIHSIAVSVLSQLGLLDTWTSPRRHCGRCVSTECFG